MTETDDFDAKLGRLCDKYLKGPDDIVGLARVEGMINEVFTRAGAKPPRRIVLRFSDTEGKIDMKFEDEP